MPPYQPPVFNPPGFRAGAARQAQDKLRAKQRLRGHALMRRNAMWLAMHPLCAVCGREAATEVDHPVPLCAGGADDESNLQGLCHACHVTKTNSERAQRATR